MECEHDKCDPDYSLVMDEMRRGRLKATAPKAKAAVPAAAKPSGRDREMLEDAVALLKSEEFLKQNWRRICYRLEKAASEFDWETASEEGKDAPLLLMRVRPLLDGIIYFGSSPEAYRLARGWLAEKLPQDADVGLVLAA